MHSRIGVGKKEAKNVKLFIYQKGEEQRPEDKNELSEGEDRGHHEQ